MKRVVNLYNILMEIEELLVEISCDFLPTEGLTEKYSDKNEMQRKYWEEMIHRLHICGLTTVVRISKWYRAMEIANTNGNYYNFCASLRGLVEACSDSFFTLNKVIHPLIDHFGTIQKIMNCEPESFLISKEMEDELIHYIYGRKLSKDELDNFGPNHSARQVREYLDAFKDSKLNSLYAQLCQVSHPSLMSFYPFLYTKSENNLTFSNISQDQLLIEKIKIEFNDVIYDVLEKAIVAALCAIKLSSMLYKYYPENSLLIQKISNILEEYTFWQNAEKSMFEQKIEK